MVTTVQDWQGVARVLGREGKLDDDRVYRVAFPRTDLRVSSFGFTLNPNLGLGTYVSFMRYADQRTMLMGDMMVTETELQRTLDALGSHGIGRTSVHKHLLAHHPPLWWIHLHALDPDPVTLARGLLEALRVAGPLPLLPVDPPARRGIDLDTEGIEAALGTRGKGVDVFKATFFRKGTITLHDRLLPRKTGGVTALTFQPVGGGRAVINGEFAMVAGEVQGVMDAVRRHGIDVVSLHSHMLMDEPRMFFLHFWAAGDAVQLARGLRAGVDLMDVDTRPGGESPTGAPPGVRP
ncbi:DUF1259 domain-containing protein [Streptomyces sp. AV19]|nr:DUF1259 domain-containing protein [Streptomyces sp. AV19]